MADHQGPVLLVESRAVLARRTFHRAKAHLVLSAMRHRAAELGDKATYVRTSGGYADAVRSHAGQRPVQVIHPTSYAALGLVERLGQELDLSVLEPRGFATARDDFERWAEGRGKSRLLMEDFYRRARRAHGVLLDGDGSDPAGGRWNFDHENREPRQGGRDARRTRAVVAAGGRDRRGGPRRPRPVGARRRGLVHRQRRAATLPGHPPGGARRTRPLRRAPAAALRGLEDAVLEGDPWMAHSLVSAPLNLGLLEPLEVVRRAEEAYLSGRAPIASVEGFVRQVLGWRDYVWHLYWHFGDSYRRRNELGATERLPQWFASLDGSKTDARCLSHTLDQVAEHGWVHHIPRLMVLGSYAMQRGWSPRQVTDWFHRAFVDGYDWVMVPNVVGMCQHADGGEWPPTLHLRWRLPEPDDRPLRLVPFDPNVRVGDDACPFTAGYWWFLHRNRSELAGNHRMGRALQGLDRLSDLDELVAQEEARGNRAP